MVPDNRTGVTSIGEIISLVKVTVKVVNVLIQIGDLFFKTPAIFNGEKKGEDGNILTLTPIVQA